MTKAQGHIDFAIVGAQKASTTFLHHAIRQSSQVWMPAGETPLFHGHHFADHKIAALTQSPECDMALIGIKRPIYLYNLDEAHRLARHNAGMKIIISLRDRVSRSLSAYFHLMRYGRLPVRDPEEGVPILLDATEAQQAQQGHTILTHSLYANGIAFYRQIFGPDNVLILSQHEILKNRDAALREICSFLDILEVGTGDLASKQLQVAYYDMDAIQLLAKAARLEGICNEAGVVLQVRREISDERRSEALDLRRKADCIGSGGGKPSLSAALHDRMLNYFADDMRRTEEMGLQV